MYLYMEYYDYFIICTYSNIYFYKYGNKNIKTFIFNKNTIFLLYYIIKMNKKS